MRMRRCLRCRVSNMELYYGGGGAQNPHFRYKVNVETVSAEAYEWLQKYEGLPCFDRFYINWTERSKKGHLEVQFEREEPALMFKLTWGCK
jgi:hypothetical protein